MMKTYLAVLRTDADLRKLEQELKKKKIILSAYYKTVGIVKLESGQAFSATDLPEYFLHVKKGLDNLKFTQDFSIRGSLIFVYFAKIKINYEL